MECAQRVLIIACIQQQCIQQHFVHHTIWSSGS
jgi:hypothetical protein